MNVYVTNCKVNMIECVQSFFSFCIFAAQGCQCPGKWRSTQYPPIFINELVQQRIYFTEKKHIKEFWKNLTKKPQIFQWVEKCVSCIQANSFWLELVLKFCPIDLKLSLSGWERNSYYVIIQPWACKDVLFISCIFYFQRVMQGGFFLLLRFFLRVDGVLVRINDTRIHHKVHSTF